MNPANAIYTFLLLAALTAPSASAQLLTLGTTPDCDVVLPPDGGNNALQQALDTGHRDLRIQRDLELLTNIQFSLGATQVSIRGGYDSCADARINLVADPSARSRLRSEGSATLMLRQSPPSAQPAAVHLERLDLRQLFAPAIPVAAVDAEHVNLRIERSSIVAFEGGSGGAIRVLAGGVTLVDSSLVANQAALGGGIWCSGSQVSVDGRSLLQGNRAERGGAIFSQSCQVIVEARPEAHPPGLLNHGLIANEASDSGGAIHAIDSDLHIQGGPHCEISSPENCLLSLALVRDNLASSAGGAVRLEGNSTAVLRFVDLIGNRAPSGGAISVGPGSALFLGEESLPDGQRPGCEGPDFCQRVVSNGPNVILLEPGERGGGALRVSGGHVQVRNTLFSNNHADFGNVLLAEEGSVAIIEQSIIRQSLEGDPEASQWLPETRSVLHARGAALHLRQSTLLRQHSNSADVGKPTLVKGESGSDIMLDRSLMLGLSWGQLHFDIEPGRATGGCNLINQSEPTPFAAWIRDVLATDPELFEPAPAFTPSSASGARDRCLHEPDMDLHRDIYGQLRVQAQGPATVDTPLDIGAVEAPGDSLFADGFE